MSHTCNNLILHCIDFRLGKAIKNYLTDNNLLGNIDIVSVAGAAKNIASPTKETDPEFILRQIDISKRLHGITSVIIMNHTDCGAYGGRKAFASDEEEKTRLIEDMKKTKETILATHPGLTVKNILAHIAETGKVSFEDVLLA